MKKFPESISQTVDTGLWWQPERENNKASDLHEKESMKSEEGWRDSELERRQMWETNKISKVLINAL